MNWNPMYSPVWGWLRDNAVPAFLLALADPAIVSTVAGPYAGTVTTVLGVLASLGFLGKRYGKTPNP